MTTRRMASLLLSSLAAIAAAASEQDRRFTDLDLTALMSMDVTVTSAARRAQASSDAAAAVYVITRDDIRHSGASSIPELLRGVPGIQVARESNSRWAVSARSSDRMQGSLYAQDELFFFSDAVRLTAGAKIEDFEYTGISVQPTRLRFKANATWLETDAPGIRAA